MTEIDAANPTLETISLPEMEKRNHVRHVCIDGGVVRLSVRPEFRGRRAILIDVSSNGIGFVLEEALPPDTILVFEVATPGGTTLGRIARVRHSRPCATPADAPWLPPTPLLSNAFRRMFGMKKPQRPDAWLVGCEFDRPLDEVELAQFLFSLQPDSYPS